jgi:hypothetical protein
MEPENGGAAAFTLMSWLSFAPHRLALQRPVCDMMVVGERADHKDSLLSAGQPAGDQVSNAYVMDGQAV